MSPSPRTPLTTLSPPPSPTFRRTRAASSPRVEEHRANSRAADSGRAERTPWVVRWRQSFSLNQVKDSRARVLRWGREPRQFQARTISGGDFSGGTGRFVAPQTIAPVESEPAPARRRDADRPAPAATRMYAVAERADLKPRGAQRIARWKRALRKREQGRRVRRLQQTQARLEEVLRKTEASRRTYDRRVRLDTTRRTPAGKVSPMRVSARTSSSSKPPQRVSARPSERNAGSRQSSDARAASTRPANRTPDRARRPTRSGETPPRRRSVLREDRRSPAQVSSQMRRSSEGLPSRNPARQPSKSSRPQRPPATVNSPKVDGRPRADVQPAWPESVVARSRTAAPTRRVRRVMDIGEALTPKERMSMRQPMNVGRPVAGLDWSSVSRRSSISNNLVPTMLSAEPAVAQAAPMMRTDRPWRGEGVALQRRVVWTRNDGASSRGSTRGLVSLQRQGAARRLVEQPVTEPPSSNAVLKSPRGSRQRGGTRRVVPTPPSMRREGRPWSGAASGSHLGKAGARRNVDAPGLVTLTRTGRALQQPMPLRASQYTLRLPPQPDGTLRQRPVRVDRRVLTRRQLARGPTSSASLGDDGVASVVMSARPMMRTRRMAGPAAGNVIWRSAERSFRPTAVLTRESLPSGRQVLLAGAWPSDGVTASQKMGQGQRGGRSSAGNADNASLLPTRRGAVQREPKARALRSPPDAMSVQRRRRSTSVRGAVGAGPIQRSRAAAPVRMLPSLQQLAAPMTGRLQKTRRVDLRQPSASTRDPRGRTVDRSSRRSILQRNVALGTASRPGQVTVANLSRRFIEPGVFMEPVEGGRAVAAVRERAPSASGERASRIRQPRLLQPSLWSGVRSRFSSSSGLVAALVPAPRRTVGQGIPVRHEEGSSMSVGTPTPRGAAPPGKRSSSRTRTAGDVPQQKGIRRERRQRDGLHSLRSPLQWPEHQKRVEQGIATGPRSSTRPQSVMLSSVVEDQSSGARSSGARSTGTQRAAATPERTLLQLPATTAPESGNATTVSTSEGTRAAAPTRVRAPGAGRPGRSSAKAVPSRTRVRRPPSRTVSQTLLPNPAGRVEQAEKALEQRERAVQRKERTTRRTTSTTTRRTKDAEKPPKITSAKGSSEPIRTSYPSDAAPMLQQWENRGTSFSTVTNIVPPPVVRVDTEREVLSVLRTLTESSPEARRLLKDVARELETLLKLDNLRKY